MSAIDSLSFHADGKFDLERFRDTRAILDLRTSKAALIHKATEARRAASILRRKTNRQACFISPSAERPIVRRFDTRGKTSSGQTFLAKSLYLSFSSNRSAAIDPRLSNSEPCVSNFGRLIDAADFRESPGRIALL